MIGKIIEVYDKKYVIKNYTLSIQNCAICREIVNRTCAHITRILDAHDNGFMHTHMRAPKVIAVGVIIDIK